MVYAQAQAKCLPNSDALKALYNGQLESLKMLYIEWIASFIQQLCMEQDHHILKTQHTEKIDQHCKLLS